MPSSLFLCLLAVASGGFEPAAQSPAPAPLFIRGVTILDAATGQLTPYLSLRMEEVAARVVSAGTAIIPTVVLFDSLFSGRSAEDVLKERKGCRYMPAGAVDGWSKLFGQYAAAMGGEAGETIR